MNFQAEISKKPLPEFSNEIKKCHYHFFEQIVTQGIGPGQQGYQILEHILRRILLLTECDSEDTLFCNITEFVGGLISAPVESQKNLLMVVLRLLPQNFQDQFIFTIFVFEHRNNGQAFLHYNSLGGKLILAVAEMESQYQPYLSVFLKFQKMVEGHIDEFEGELKEETLKALVQLLNETLSAIITSAHEVPQLVKIVCKNINDVSIDEIEAVKRIAGFFMYRYLGGLIVRRNEFIDSNSGIGNLIIQSNRIYILKFLQRLGTTYELGKREDLDSPLIDVLTEENLEKLTVFLKSLCDVKLEREEPFIFQADSIIDIQELIRLEANLTFMVKYYAICSLFQELKKIHFPEQRRRSASLSRTSNDSSRRALKKTQAADHHHFQISE